MKFSTPIYSFSFVLTCGSNPYNPPCLPSHYSLTPPLPLLNCQFSLVTYFSPPFNPFFLYFPLFRLLLVLLSSWIDCNKSQDWFFFLSTSTLATFFPPFFLNLHLEIENITCTWGHPSQSPCNNVFFLWWNFIIFQQKNWDLKKIIV